MRVCPTWTRVLAVLIVPLLVWAMLPASTGASPIGWSSIAAATPVFLQHASNSPLPASPPTRGPVLLGGTIETSTIPPGPGPGAACSVDNPAGGNCSAFAANELCSARNGDGALCSAFDNFAPAPTTCSAFGMNSACSVLPPNSGNQTSFCSSIPQFGTVPTNCSAVGTARNQRCSAKGNASPSFCTALNGSNAPSDCSVLNQGANQRSFCSTKFNQPQPSKLCSSHTTPGGQCSVISGGNGVCTTFGQADPGSCSAFNGDPNSCSVIGGAPGNPCAQ